MIELQADRAPSAELGDVLRDCASRDADYRTDKNFTDVKSRLRLELWREQGSLCVYCERKLPCETEMERHGDLSEECRTRIDHIKPRTAYPQLCFEYTNLALSCPSADSCDRKKGSKELQIAPSSGVNAYFELKSDGRLEPIGSKREKNALRRDIEDILGLNSPSLLRARRALVRLLQNSLAAGHIDEEDILAVIEHSEFRCTLYQWWGGGSRPS